MSSDDPQRPGSAGASPTGPPPADGSAPQQPALGAEGDGPVPVVDGVPDADELARTATPARVRRAPRYRAFVWSGVALGALLALVLVLVLPGESGGAIGPVTVWAVLAVGLGLAGALVGAVVAVLLDRSARR